MNCITSTRFLGRRLTLTSTDGQVSQTEHEETLPVGFMGSLNPQPVKRDDVKLRFEDGGEVCLSVLDGGFSAKPGQKVTAVRADDGKDSPLLYCYNHQTRDSWFNRLGINGLRKRAPLRKILLIAPLLIVLGAWLSPAQTRADVAGWIEQRTFLGTAPASQRPTIGQVVRIGPLTATAVPEPDSQNASVGAMLRSAADFALDGWRDRNWIAFGVVIGVLIPLTFAFGHVLLVWPATRSFRWRVRRLADQHRKAVRAG